MLGGYKFGKSACKPKSTPSCFQERCHILTLIYLFSLLQAITKETGILVFLILYCDASSFLSSKRANNSLMRRNLALKCTSSSENLSSAVSVTLAKGGTQIQNVLYPPCMYLMEKENKGGKLSKSGETGEIFSVFN